MTRLESSTERMFVAWIEDCGWQCWKLWPMGRAGLPDRIILLPKGRAFFIEFKRKGKVARKLQQYIHNKLKELGYYVFICDNIIEAGKATRTVCGKYRIPAPPIPEGWYSLAD